MITLKTVLVATDFSEPSEVAVRYGRALADAFHATLHVMHVVPDSMSLPWATMSDGLAMADVQKQWELEARERLEGLIPEADRRTFGIVFVTRAGEPVRQILGYAADQEIDLIVLGTHGRGAVAHMLLGSVAERVVRNAPCPVLTVRHPQHDFVNDSVSRLVGEYVGADTTPMAERVHA